MASMRQGEVMTGLALAGLGVYIVAQSLQWVLIGKDGPGPGFFPLIYGLLMVVLSLALATQALLKTRPVDPAPGEGKSNSSVGAALAVWLTFTCVILLMKFIGFAVALSFLVLFMTRVVFSRTPRFAVISAIAVPLVFYLIFKIGLQVQLPVGTWTGI